METVCRLCASSRQSSVLESVFSFHKDRLLTDLISLICPIKLDIKDNLPKNICEECLEIVVSASKLRETSVKCDISFRNGDFIYPQQKPNISLKIKQEKNTAEEDPYANMDEQSSYDETEWFQEPSAVGKMPQRNEFQYSVARKIDSNGNQFRWPCPSGCEITFAFQNSIYRHVRRFHDPNLLPVACNFCTIRFVSHQKLQLHMMKCHENKEEITVTKHEAPVKKPVEYERTTIQQPEETSEKFEDAEGFFECDICGLCYDRKLNILLHMKMYHMTNPGDENDPENGGKYKCDECDTSFSFAGNMHRHKRRFHSGDNPYPCNICPHRFRYHRLLKLHHQKFHNGDIFTEDQGFDPRGKSASCQYCDKDFRGNRRHLEAHMLRYHLDEFEPLECHLCWKKVVFPETLKTHIDTHNKNIKRQSFPHECPKCLKRFLKSESLDRHMKSHSIDLGRACLVCGKRFNSTLALEEHIRRHENEKDFPCSQCSGKFMSQTELDRHMTTHSSERPYECELCPLTFKNYDILKNHMKKIHYKTMKRKFACNFCLRKFYTPHSLERHTRTHKETL